MKVLLIDTPLVYMANKSKVGHLRTSTGFKTGALYGTIRQIEAMARDLGTKRVFLCFEGDRSTEARRKVMPAYKGDRQYDGSFWDPDHKFMLIEWGLARGYSVASAEGREADDVIAYITKDAVESGHEVVIMSRDHDYKALLQDDVVSMQCSVSDKPWTAQRVRNEVGVEPEQYQTYLALTGDATDNVEGFFKPKAAKEILSMGGTAEGVYQLLMDQAVDETLDIDDRFQASKAATFFNKAYEVVTFADCEDKVVVARTGYKEDTLRDLYTKLEFNSLLKTL